MTPQEASKVLDMFLDKQCDLKRTEFAYSNNEVWTAVNIASEVLDRQIEGNGFACNIGDTLYSVGSVTQDIVELTVEGFQIAKNDTFIFCHGGIYISVSQQWGESVFPTREEAEENRERLAK